MHLKLREMRREKASVWTGGKKKERNKKRKKERKKEGMKDRKKERKNYEFRRDKVRWTNRKVGGG